MVAFEVLTRLCHVLSETIWEYRALPAPSNYSYLAFSMDPMDRWRRTYTDFEVRGHLEWLLFELEYTKQNQCVSIMVLDSAVFGHLALYQLRKAARRWNSIAKSCGKMHISEPLRVLCRRTSLQLACQYLIFHSFRSQRCRWR